MRYSIGSISKQFTAAAILLLQEQGKLSLDDKVAKFIPNLTRANEVTIRQLLSHTSGYQDYWPQDYVMPMMMQPVTAQKILDLWARKPLDFEPGAKWQYSNLGIATLGRIIEVVADQPYEKFIESRIFLPLGMKDSFFFLPADRQHRLATVYVLDKGKLKKADWDFSGNGAKYPFPEGGMYSTALDLASFYQMMLNGGSYNGKRILSRATAEMMTEVHTGELQAGHSPGMGYGPGGNSGSPGANERFRALGWSEVPVLVVHTLEDERRALKAEVHENTMRLQLSPYEAVVKAAEIEPAIDE